MNSSRKGVTAEQLRQVAKDLNLTVATIAEGTGLSKSYISEFRNETRNLSASQQTQLRSYLEDQCAEAGRDFPETKDTSSQDLLHGLGGLVQRVTRPAILLSEDLPKDQVDKLTHLIDVNRIKATELLEKEFDRGSWFGNGFSADTEDVIRELFALLAMNYIAILMLQGRNIARKLPAEFEHKTIGDWLSSHLSSSALAEHLPADDEASNVETEEEAA